MRMNLFMSGPDALAPPGGHLPVRSGRIGVLLVNLGTPEATDYWSMRRYLKEFLSDRRVIETRACLVADPQLVILSRRPREGARLRLDLEQRARRGPAEDHHARAGEKIAEALAQVGGPARRRRLGDALWQTGDRRAA